MELTLFDTPPPGEGDPALPGSISIPHRWVLRPTQVELRDLYGGSDVFVSAERRAGWNNTVAEAMACGVPVVCTGSGTLDLARHWETAWVVRWRHPWSLASGIQRLAACPELRGELRSRAAARVRGFSWERVADRLEGVVRERLGRSSGGS